MSDHPRLRHCDLSWVSQMSTVPAALVTVLVLFAAGAFPAVALAGPRAVTVVLAPLAGSVMAGLAATCFMEWGWSFIGWFVVLAVIVVLVVIAAWVVWPDRRPRLLLPVGSDGGPWCRAMWVVGAFCVLGACAWSLRALATPTVGFDARAIWLLRGAWFIGSHRQLLIDFRSPDVPLIQTPYPPLVSAAVALAMRLTGNSSPRLGVVVVALLNSCALVVATLALLDAGRTVTRRLRLSSTAQEGAAPREERKMSGVGIASREHSGLAFVLSLAPMIVAVVTSVTLVFITFGITEPFFTNGYADPIWSLTAVGAVAYGMQLPTTALNRGTAVVLVLVAGLSKNEGVVIASGLAILIAARVLFSQFREDRRRQWWRPVATVVAELCVIGSWPAVMRQIHARGLASSHSPVRDWSMRARVTYDWMAPYLHVLVLATPIAVLGGLALSRVRRAGGLGSDWWAWAGLSGGLFAIGGTFVVGASRIVDLLEGTAHRVTEFPALAAWWIIAMWAITTSATPALAVADRHRVTESSTSAESESELEPEPEPERLSSSLDLPVA